MAPLEIDSEVLGEVDKRVVDGDRASADRDRALHPPRLEAGVAIAEPFVETARRVVADAVADAEPAVAAARRDPLGVLHECGRDASPAAFLQHEDVLYLRDTDLGLRPRDVGVADRLVAVPRDEIGLRSVETAERQPRVDALDLARVQLADVDAATSLRRNVSAPSLSSISLRLPHFGLWTHEGQPSAQGHPSSIRAVSATHPSNASKPR